MKCCKKLKTHFLWKRTVFGNKCVQVHHPSSCPRAETIKSNFIVSPNAHLYRKSISILHQQMAAQQTTSPRNFGHSIYYGLSLTREFFGINSLKFKVVVVCHGLTVKNTGYNLWCFWSSVGLNASCDTCVL